MNPRDRGARETPYTAGRLPHSPVGAAESHMMIHTLISKLETGIILETAQVPP